MGRGVSFRFWSVKLLAERVRDITEEIRSRFGLPLGIVLAEEIGQEVARRSKVVDWKTEIINLKNRAADKDFVVVERSGVGRLVELAIVAGSTSFSFQMELDEQEPFERTFSELETLGYFGGVSAVTDPDGNATMRVTDIRFFEGLTITLKPNALITFNIVGTLEVPRKEEPVRRPRTVIRDKTPIIDI